MSRMQQSTTVVKCDYAHLDSKTTPEANNQEPLVWITAPSCDEGSHLGRSRIHSTAWTILHPTSKDERNGSETNKKLKAFKSGPTGRSDRKRSSRGSERPMGHKGFGRLPISRNEEDSVSSQIRIFKEREDLRECLLPGMVGKISQKACEGWRRQATASSARFMSKIKLGPCKDCRYFEEPCGKGPRIHSERRSQLGQA
jgi:hypothetical protein